MKTEILPNAYLGQEKQISRDCAGFLKVCM